MDGCAVAGELNDTLPARALARLLPLDLTFTGTGIALCAPLPVELPRDDALIHCGWRDGDINYSVQAGGSPCSAATRKTLAVTEVSEP